MEGMVYVNANLNVIIFLVYMKLNHINRGRYESWYGIYLYMSSENRREGSGDGKWGGMRGERASGSGDGIWEDIRGGSGVRG